MSGLRGRILAATAIAAWAAIGIGAADLFYLRVYTYDRASLGAYYRELTYRRIPGLRAVLDEGRRRTPPGARVLIALPHRRWQGGYGYGFRRAQYVLEGREVIPLLDRATDRIDPSGAGRSDFILCWRECQVPPGFELMWRGEDGILLRRAG